VIAAQGALFCSGTLLEANGPVDFDIEDYISGLRYFFADAMAKMIGCPFKLIFAQSCSNNRQAPRSQLVLRRPSRGKNSKQVTAPSNLKDAGYVALSQSHLPWIFVENFSRAMTSRRHQQQWVWMAWTHRNPCQHRPAQRHISPR